MPTPPEKTLEDKLFPKRLGRISYSQFIKEAGAHGLTPEKAMNLTWTDGQGREWSVLSRLGYMHFTAETAPRNEQMLAQALRHHGEQGLRRQTQPGEPDLLWAWLGYSTLNISSASLVEDMNKAFAPVRHASPDLPASGCGVVGDGGWVDTALGMLEALIKRRDIPARSEHCIDNWMRENLLAIEAGTTKGQHVWYGLGRFESGTGLYDHSQPQVAWGDKRVPWKTGAYMVSTRRPPLLAERFSEVWSRLLRLSTKTVLRCETVSNNTTFPTWLSQQSAERDIIECLDEHAVGAMEDHLRTCLLVRRDQRPHGSTISVLNLWLQASPQMQTLTQEEQHRMARRLCAPVTNHQPGEPEGSWLDWNAYEVTPALLAWTKSIHLEKAFERDSPQEPRPARTVRM